MTEPGEIRVPELLVRGQNAELSARLAAMHAGAAGTQEWPGADGRPIGFSGALDGRCFIVLHGVATYLFDGGSGAVEAVAEACAEREWIEDSYRRLALPLVLQVRGIQVLHASAVDTPGGLVVLCGFSGSGKSTLAYGLGRRGCRIWADDAVAFRVEGGSVAAHPLPFRVRLLPDAAEYFLPSSSIEGGKLTVEEPAAATPRGPRPIALGLFLESEEREGAALEHSEIQAVSPTAAFRRLLLHGFFFHHLPDDSRGYRSVILEYLELAGQVPFYGVRRGEGLAGLEGTLSAIEGRISRLSS